MREARTVAVGIGELYVTNDEAAVLAAYGLGSCVGVSIYDPVARVGGLAHIMLPTSREAAFESASTKFADVAIPILVERSVKLGAAPHRIICKIAGGAQLIAPGHLNGFRIGERNVEAVREALRQHRIEPRAADVGGSQGRTMRLFVDSGRVLVRTVGHPDVEL